jgi:hypothetical protein
LYLNSSSGALGASGEYTPNRSSRFPLHSLNVSTWFASLIGRDKAIAITHGLAILRYTAIEFSVMQDDYSGHDKVILCLDIGNIKARGAAQHSFNLTPLRN